ncbi:hypothetical protein GCM10027026_42470 [Myroides odoratimimus subsp. xuanwuensis]
MSDHHGPGLVLAVLTGLAVMTGLVGGAAWPIVAGGGLGRGDEDGARGDHECEEREQGAATPVPRCHDPHPIAPRWPDAVPPVNGR